MSQNPPPPPGFNPANQPQPNFAMQPRGNGPAVASLVCALLGFCVPGVGGLLGIILGFVGLGRAKEVAKGRGMAIAGIIIGVITLLAWAGTGYGIYKGTHALANLAKPEREAARQYITDLSKNDLDAAANDSQGISKEDLASQAATLQPLGALLDVTTFGFNAENGIWKLTGVAKFANGTKTFTLTIDGHGGPKVTAAIFQ